MGSLKHRLKGSSQPWIEDATPAAVSSVTSTTDAATAAVSVTSSTEDREGETRAGDRSISSNMSQAQSDIEVFIFKSLRTLGLTFLVYVVGWFGFHWVWVFGGVVMFLIRMKPHKERREEKKKVFGAMCEDEASLLLKYEDLPSWVCFPDTQRAEWLNRCFSQMWPFISDMVSGILKESVEPEIKKHMPSVLKSFHFVEADLGSQPLRIGGIRVYTEHVKPNEILLDAEIIYTGDAVVQVGFSTGTLGIKDLEVRGTVRVELRPILPKPPLVGAVSVYFLESPEIDFDFTNLLNFFDITGVDYLIKVAIGKVIDSCMVLPQRITVPIAGPESLVSLQYPMPLGVLKTKILSATGLKAMDHKLFKKDSSDPFVKAKVCRKTHETKVVENSLSPTWNDESFMIFVDRVIGTSITFDVMDYDKNGKHDLIGRAQKNLEELYHGGDKKNDFILQLEDGGGSLSCELEWFNFIEDASYIKKHINDDTPTVTCLFVKLEYATGLPAIKMEDGTCSPHVEIILGETTIQSKTKRNTKKPIWNELHYFFVHNPAEGVIFFKVKDESDESLGHFKLNISKLVEVENELKISDLFALQNCFTDGQIKLTLELKGLVSGLCVDGTTYDK